MKPTIERVLGEVGVPILSYLDLSDIIKNLNYANKFMEIVTEYSCNLQLKNLNYTWMNVDLVGEVRRKGHFKKLLYFVTRKGAIILGGQFDSRRCKYFSPTTRRFSTMNYMSIKGNTMNSTAVWHRGRMFVFPCNVESADGSMEIYNPVLATWSKAKGIPAVLKSCAAASCRDSLFILGGDNYSKPQWKKSNGIFLLSNQESDDERQFQWTKLDVSLIRGRAFHAAVAFKGRIWLAGGVLEKRVGDIHNDELVTKSVEIFDPLLGTVVQGPDMTRTRFQTTLAVINDSLWVIGGDVHRTERTLGTIEKYNEENERWELITHFPKNRTRCAICAVNSFIYLFGGCEGRQSYNDWDAYNVDTDRWLSQDDPEPFITPVEGPDGGAKGPSEVPEISVNPQTSTVSSSARLIYPGVALPVLDSNMSMLMGARAVTTSSS